MGSFYISEDVTRDGVAVLAAGGEIDYEASPQLRKSIAGHIKAGVGRLLLDLSSATFIDSTAIGVLVSSANALRESHDGSLAIVCPEENENVHRILEIAGLRGFIPVGHTRQEALSVLVPGG